jgi:signal transduction histidine kinase
MASDKEPSPQSEREKTVDSNSASEQQADVNRDAERVVADKAKRQSRSDSDASRDLGRADVGRSGAECQAEGDERLRVERKASDEAILDERFRTDAATERGRTHHQASAKSSADLLSREQESHRKTQTALTTREEFLAIVSHDLRNPLNHISMAA